MNHPTYCIIHHTVSPTTTTREQVDAWHKARGFGGIGYHVLVNLDSHGVPHAVTGRPAEQTGAHCPGYNSKSIGVCVAGNWSKDDPDDPQYAAMWLHVRMTVRLLMDDYNIPVENVLGHREARPNHTECPGLKLDMDAFRASLKETV